MRSRNWPFPLLVVLGAIGCQGEPASETEGGAEKTRLVVFTVNYPLAYFARRVGGELVDVEFPFSEEGDPAFWMPDAETIAHFQQADVIVINGAAYAKWLAKVSLPPSRICDSSAAFRSEYIRTSDVTHRHGPQGVHSHGEIAFTTWLDPQQAIQQADAIRAAFAHQLPQHAAEFRENFAELKRDLTAIGTALDNATSNSTEHPLVFSHPVYQYLTRRLELNAISVHWEPDAMPDEEQWQELQKRLKEHPAKWMVWEAQPLAEVRGRLRQLGVTSIVFDPCAARPANGDYLSAQRSNVQRLARVFAEQN